MKRISKTSARHNGFTSLPCRLTGGIVKLRPTPYGVLFLAVLGVMLAGSVRYNNNLGFLLSFLLGGMALVSLVHTRRNLEGLRILSWSAAPVFAGESTQFLLSADPGARRRKAVSFGFANSESYLTDLPGGRSVELALKTPPLARGLFRGGPLYVVSHYPLGLFAARARLRTDASALVYPRPLPGPFDPGLQEAGNHPAGSVAEKSGTDDFQGLSAYQPGDPLQRLSWKAFSRGMGLFTKSFVSHSGGGVRLDWFHLEGMDTEQRLGRLCAMVLQAQRMGRAFGLRLPDRDILPLAGAGQARRCLAELALFGTGQPGRGQGAARWGGR